MAVAQVPLVSIGFPGTHANVLPDSKVTAGLDANRPKSERVRKFLYVIVFQSDFDKICRLFPRYQMYSKNKLEIYD